ncbi:very-long-chain aldehyde decarbonylase CER1-like isoform X2 [Quercus lobata]|uniref:very-long-chain aldehyde decarbonylase CER1-like isoform X2 n=1 Tax=Quercus lobata TaxID=97700 RepID=UPI001246E417|nr:very-long-chain aldehyde decarbonylase CER1-like isoform X2 [Quercus lobata]
MASNPGILSYWPWKHLGSFKYLILAPWAVHSIYSFLFKEESKRDLTNFFILPFLLWRMLHNQIWISISRYRNAKGNNLLVDKSLQFEQVDREQSWFHSLHHTQFQTNYCLFMPLYDYIYGTMDKSSDTLYEISLKKNEKVPHVVHLTHLTTLDSIYHLRLGFSFLASSPHTSKWYMWLMWPLTLLSTMLTWIYGRTFVVERNQFGMLTLQTWVIPKYSVQYFLRSHENSINDLIEQATLEAEKKGVKVLSLGLLNQGEELNGYGGVYVKRNPQLKIKVVDGSSLAAAIVLNSIPKGTTQVLLRGKITKVACAIAVDLCKQGIQVATLQQDEYMKISKFLEMISENSLILSKSYSQKIWLVGDRLTEEEQLKVPKGTLFIPYSQFPPKKFRKDCLYHSTPAMLIPTSLENVHSCENWLPRRVMSAWRIAGIVHALEGWNEHECGYTMSNMEKVWQASLQHGFQPLMFPNGSKY